MPEMITVSALNRYVRSLLESDEVLFDIAIEGEISNFNRHFKTGHCYFSLKDSNASVKAVMFRSSADALTFQPENGMSVVARCRVSLYERDGAFQLYVDALFPSGVGLAQQAFEQLKERLAKEGLFAQEHKKPIPAFPHSIGIVTSKTGAAIQDIIHVAQRRSPGIELLLAPVRVQGLEAAPEITSAIKQLDMSGLVDIIIIARGGGSSEDLAVFNDEVIARTVYDSSTPVISAIGHETDFTILDFVADLRAPTPSAAAELALPDIGDQLKTLHKIFNSIQNIIQNKLQLCYNSFMRGKSNSALLNVGKSCEDAKLRLKQLAIEMAQKLENKLDGERQWMEASAALASSLNPYSVLSRGYAIPQIEGIPFKTVGQAHVGQNISIQMQDGVIHSVIDSIETHSERNDETEEYKL